MTTALWFATDLAPAGIASPVPAKVSLMLSSAVAPAEGRLARQALSPSDLRLRVDVTTKELRAASEQHRQFELELSSASAETEELRIEISDVAEETLHNAIAGYRHSEIPQGLLTVDDVTAGMRATALGGAAVSSDTESFEAYRDLRKDLELEEAELVGRQQQVEESVIEVSRLETELSSELDQLGDAEERRIIDQATAISVQASNRAQARGRKQGFYLDTCPVSGPHEFIDSWGFARSGGRRHQGVDMLAPMGTALVAPVSGRVEHFDNSVGGRSYRLYGDDDIYFYGTHLSGFAKSGQVQAGEVIGYVGDDGNAAGIPHLHFEIRPGGRSSPAINPFVDVASVCSGARY